ncbi:MAG: polysaccharide deacetylase family protein, partial [Dehalococcoidia bacterium]
MTKSLPRRIAVAFEGGEDPEPAAAMLDALAVGGITATFFIDGLWAEECPEIVRRISDEGHEVGNHGHGHPDWTALSDEEVRADLARVDGIVRSICGASTGPWVLPPKSAIDERVEAVLAGAGYRSVNPYPLDGRGWDDQSPAAIHQRAMQQLEGGASL